MSVNEKMTAIADAIRSKTGSTDKLGLDAMATAVDDVYITGHLHGELYGYQIGSEEGTKNGYAIGKEDGYTEGQQAEYDRFWNVFQQNGNRGNYGYAFASQGWTKEIFTPKYTIKPVSSANGIFYYFGYQCGDNNMASLTFDMLDFSGLTSKPSTAPFYNCWFERIEVDLTVSSVFDNMGQVFNGADGGKIHHIVIKMKPKSLSNTFYYLAHLKTLTFVEGSEIGCNGFDINKATRLDKASLLGVFDVLVDKSADTSGTSWVVTLGATNLAKLTDAEKASAISKGWTLA